MSQNNCECNEYSQLTAKTGIAQLTTANSSLDGSGDVTEVLTAGDSGTILKSVIVKSRIPTIMPGMVRLFIKKGDTDAVLFKEIPVPVMPVFYPVPSIPISLPTLLIQPTFVAYLVCDVMMEDGDVLCATTQNEGEFVVIAEGLDIAYPETTPIVCCDFKQTLPNTGYGIVSIANTQLDSPGTIVPIFTADPDFNGSLIKSISIDALQSTGEGLIRFFMSDDDGTTYYLMNEIKIPQTTQASDVPAFKINLPQHYNLQAGYLIAAATVTPQKFGISIQAEKWTYSTPPPTV